MCFFCALRANLTTSMAFRGFVLMTSFLALRASVCIFLWCLFNYFARFGLDGTATWMEQLPGLDTAARMEQLPGWNNYLGSNLRPQTTRAVTLPIELRGASTWGRAANNEGGRRNAGQIDRLMERQPTACIVTTSADKTARLEPFQSGT